MSTVWQPSTDISETTKEFIVRADLPGVNKEDIELSVVDGQLNIRGKRHENKREEKEDVIRVERFSGMFFRRIPLSKIVDAEKIAAEYRDGELVVHIPKSKESVPKKIKIA
jgi:HSP20 family protein